MANIMQQTLKAFGSSALILTTIFGTTLVAAQSQPSVIQKIKDAARQAAQQKAQQKAQQAGVPTQPGQIQTVNGQANASGPFKPPAGTKVEETPLAPLVPGARFYISPHGVHVATVENSGSRVVVIYDNVPGPKFDEIITPNSGAVFSPDGTRYAYCARSGNQFVFMVDGKELIRSSDAQNGRISFGICDPHFTSDSKHVYYLSHYSPPNRSNGFTRVVWDGKAGPDGIAGDVAFSPDGEHYAYVINEQDSGNHDHFKLIVDGQTATFLGSPQWSGDSKHLFTTSQTNVPGRGLVTDLMFDGKPVMRANLIKTFPSPVGNGAISIVTVVAPNNQPTSFLAVGSKKIPGSDIAGITGGIDSVVFSPDGKHYAAACHLESNHWVLIDGKKGLEYQEVSNLAFTADSSKAVYLAGANNKHFIVTGEEESDGFNALFPPVLSPVGGRIGALVTTLDSSGYYLMMDGKSRRTSYSGVDLQFSPDGSHYAYWKYQSGGLQIVEDGVPQPASSLGQATQQKYVFSPDGKHLGHFGVPPQPDGTYDIGVFLDGKYIKLGPRPFDNLTFSPDSKHVYWTHLIQNQDFRAFIDGKPVVDGSMAGIPQQLGPGWWDITPDGTLLFLSEDDNSLKRISVTPSDSTSVATLTGGGTMSAANH